MRIKPFFLLLVPAACGFVLDAEQLKKPDHIFTDVRIFSDAQTALDDADYGLALKLAEQAKDARKRKIAWEVETLNNSFKPAEVKYVGDSIEDSIPVLQERQDYDALEIIALYRKKPGLEFFNDSKEQFVQYVKSRSPFPEADFLAGYIYQLEGEYDIAEKCYKKALASADVLDIPDEKYDILYALAEISLIRQDFSHYEEYLLNIVAQDNAFKDEGLIAAMNRTIRSRSADCLEKFFLLYRAENFRLLNAYFKLSDWYREQDAAQRALDASALGALTGFTKIFAIVKARNPGFQYKGFEALLDAAAAYPDVVEWGVDNNLWKGFYLLAEQAEKTGSTVFAEKLYAAIWSHSPETYWRDAAAARLEAFRR